MRQSFLPGPTPVTSGIWKAFQRGSTIKFGSLNFQKLYNRIRDMFCLSLGLKPSEGVLYILSGSGTLGMQTVVNNLTYSPRPKKVLSYGRYGDNWEKMVFVTENFDEDIKGIIFTQILETTTGISPNLEDISYKYKKSFIVVDAVSGYLTESIDPDSFDVFITASQKALGLPPGMVMIWVKNTVLNELERYKHNDIFDFYCDFVDYAKYFLKGNTKFTPPINHIYALHEVYKQMTTIYNKNKDYGASSQTLNNFFSSKTALIHNHIKKVIELPVRKNTNANGVVVFDIPIYANLLQSTLEKNGVWVAGGMDGLQGEIIRMSLMEWSSIWDNDFEQSISIINQIIKQISENFKGGTTCASDSKK